MPQQKDVLKRCDVSFAPLVIHLSTLMWLPHPSMIIKYMPEGHLALLIPNTLWHIHACTHLAPVPKRPAPASVFVNGFISRQ